MYAKCLVEGIGNALNINFECICLKEWESIALCKVATFLKSTVTVTIVTVLSGLVPRAAKCPPGIYCHVHAFNVGKWDILVIFNATIQNHLAQKIHVVDKKNVSFGSQ